jgi:molybdopterin-guanine dinucleotide biosynthesis protein A
VRGGRERGQSHGKQRTSQERTEGGDLEEESSLKRVSCLVVICSPLTKLEAFSATFASWRAAWSEIVLSAPRLEPLVSAGFPAVAPGGTAGEALSCLHASLIMAEANHVVAVSCDEPLPSPELLQELAHHRSRSPILVLQPEAGGALRPFPGRYSRLCVGSLRRALCGGQTDLATVISQLKPAKLESQVAAHLLLAGS